MPGSFPRDRRLAGGLLDSLLAAAGFHDQLRAEPAAADPGGDAAAGGDGVGQLDDLLPGQHTVALGLDPDAPPHGMLHAGTLLVKHRLAEAAGPGS